MDGSKSSNISPQEIAQRIDSAYSRVSPQLLPTTLVRDEHLKLWFKPENLQQTGSFKWRGALARLSLMQEGKQLVSASTGNHGLGVATAANLFHLKATIFIPNKTAERKKQLLHSLGAEIRLVDGDSLTAELTAKQFSKENNLPWVSPYNDPDVISGQGTIGKELLNELDHIDKVYITVGGGGLISGIGSWLQIHSPHTEIVACQPQNSPEMSLSIAAGEVVEAPNAQPTLSDGSAGPLEADSITFGLCQTLIDRFILVSEQEIEEAIRMTWNYHDMVIEGSAGVAIAAAAKDLKRKPEDTCVVVLCGGNIDEGIHQRICHL